jgi:hypothetical protein
MPFDEIRISGSETSITPPEGHVMPACKKCFEVPTRLILVRVDLASRFRAKAIGITPPKYMAHLRPCDHITAIDHQQDLQSVVYGLLGANPDAPPVTCGSQCPVHEHTCQRSPGHQSGICRDQRQKNTQSCSWNSETNKVLR